MGPTNSKKSLARDIGVPALIVQLVLGVIAFKTITPEPVKAEGGWIEVYRRFKNEPNQYLTGTNGYTLCIEDKIWCGEVAYVDAQSIVRKGAYVYYNFDFDLLRYSGLPQKSERSGRGREANCENKTINRGQKGWVTWASIGGWDAAAAQFACR